MYCDIRYVPKSVTAPMSPDVSMEVIELKYRAVHDYPAKRRSTSEICVSLGISSRTLRHWAKSIARRVTLSYFLGRELPSAFTTSCCQKKMKIYQGEKTRRNRVDYIRRKVFEECESVTRNRTYVLTTKADRYVVTVHLIMEVGG